MTFSDEAALNLAALKFSQSNRGPDPRDPSRIVTTTTTTTFSMTRDMAKAMCQHFMDARLIENAADRNSNLFKERGVFVLTPKGLHVLERFISKNGISAEPLQKVFQSQPICLKLLHLERRSSDDEIIISHSVVTALFRRFAGRSSNYMPDQSVQQLDASQEYHERSKGIPLMDVTERQPGLLGRNNINMYKYCFQAVTALEWLCDFTSIVGRDEAAEMAAHFVRFGLIALVSDKRKGNDSAIIFTVRGSAPPGNSPVSVCFRFGYYLHTYAQFFSLFSNKESSGVRRRLFTVSQMKVAALLAGMFLKDVQILSRLTHQLRTFRRMTDRRWTRKRKEVLRNILSLLSSLIRPLPKQEYNGVSR